MYRAFFENGQQQNFLQSVHTAGYSWDSIASICGVCTRTVRDWRREKFKMSYEAAVKLSEISGVAMPIPVEVRPEYWSTVKAGRAGAITRGKIYGNPGTPEGRAKGGRASQAKRRENPELYMNCVKRKEIARPDFSPLLAEFAGIMLGDGRIANYQISVSLNSETDAGYSKFVIRIIKALFDIDSFIFYQKHSNSLDVVASSRNLVEYLCKIGLQEGNKVAHQVDVPAWIFDDEKYMRSCLRGLMDTDGGVYLHKYKVNGKSYQYIKMCYTSHSKPLLYAVEKILKHFDFNPKNDEKKRVYLHRSDEVHKYFKEVGTSNPKHLSRYKQFALESNR
jgi:hypothetical protein